MPGLPMMRLPFSIPSDLSSFGLPYGSGGPTTLPPNNNFFPRPVVIDDGEPAFDQLPLSLSAAMAIGYRVKNWTLLGSGSWTGPDSTSGTFDFQTGNVVTSLFSPTGPVADMSEMQILLQYSQLGAGTDSLGLTDAYITLATGWAPDTLGQQAGKLFNLAFFALEISAGGGLEWSPYDTYGSGDSGVDFKVCGFSQTLFVQNLGYSYTGSLKLTGDASAGWFGYNGIFDVNTGARL